jgi:hypothetical protein
MTRETTMYPTASAVLLLATLGFAGGACLAAEGPYKPKTVKPSAPATYKPKLERPQRTSTYKPALVQPRAAATYKPQVRRPSQERTSPAPYRPSGPVYTVGPR